VESENEPKYTKSILGGFAREYVLEQINYILFFILGLSSVVDYSCTLTPLFSIEMLSNQSYILQLNFSPPRSQNGNDAYQNPSEFFKISNAICFSDKIPKGEVDEYKT
jgi:hypothetical protein